MRVQQHVSMVVTDGTRRGRPPVQCVCQFEEFVVCMSRPMGSIFQEETDEPQEIIACFTIIIKCNTLVLKDH